MLAGSFSSCNPCRTLSQFSLSVLHYAGEESCLDRAELHHQRCKGEHIKTIGTSVNLHDGRLIDKTKLSKDYAESNAEVEVKLKKQRALPEHLLKECHVAEAFCLGQPA